MARAGTWSGSVLFVGFLTWFASELSGQEVEPQRFSSDREFTRGVVDRVSGRVLSPGIALSSILALSEDGRWAFGTRGGRTPVVWSLEDPDLFLEPSGEPLSAGETSMIAVAPGGQWILWSRASETLAVSRFYRLDPVRRAVVPFHTIQGKRLKLESVRSDGSLAILSSPGDRPRDLRMSLIEIDPRKDKAIFTDLDFGTVPVWAQIDLDRHSLFEVDRSLVRPFTVEKSEHGSLLRPGAEETQTESAQFSSDGHWRYVVRNEDLDARIERLGNPAFVLALGPLIRWASFTTDSRWFLCGGVDSVVRVWDLQVLGTEHPSPTFEQYIPDHMGKTSEEAPPLVQVRADRHLVLARSGSAAVELHELEGISAREFVVEGIPVTWARQVAPPGGWPAIEVRARLDHTAGVLTVSVENTGITAANQVRVALSTTPAVGPAADPLYFGSLGPQEMRVRTRRIELDRWTTPIRCRVQADGVGVRSSPETLLVLPRWIRDEAHYHEIARAVFEAGVAILREILQDPSYSPTLSSMSHFGFQTSGRNTVLYQVPGQLDTRGVHVNRRVMAVPTQEEFDRHAQMFLLWFIPHELIHTLKTPTNGSWRREREANLLQPHLTARILERLGDRTPFTPETMAWVYERYANVLGRYAPEGVEAALQCFAVDPRAPIPYSGEAFEYFLENTPEYVHFIAYLNRYSWNRGLGLEALIRGATAGEN